MPQREKLLDVLWERMPGCLEKITQPHLSGILVDS
ncbi:hypothetical protein predicted by Glimmer/Critica [Corynebacterium glutamicum ATCC 13032]|nr:hypothetical protein predicted by Glimmer/Critica [Corynebacterium glutamicum ATCC 13032]